MRCCRWVYVRLLLDSCSLHKMPGKPPYWSWNSKAVNPLSLRRAGLNILSLAIWPCTSDMHRLICSANWDNSCKSSLLLESSPSVSSSYDLRIPAMIFSVWRLITVLWYLPSLSNPRKCLLPPEINISSVFYGAKFGRATLRITSERVRPTEGIEDGIYGGFMEWELEDGGNYNSVGFEKTEVG